MNGVKEEGRHRVVYNREQLLNCRLYPSYLDGETVKTIRMLRINKRKRGKRGGCMSRRKEKKKPLLSGSNPNNLQKVTLNTDKPIASSKISNLKLMLCNVQSLKSKEDIISKYVRDERIDVTLTTETWLKEEDTAWIQSSEFQKDPYRISTSHRDGRRGSGVAIIYNKNIQVHKTKEGQLSSFQYAVWKIMSNKL